MWLRWGGALAALGLFTLILLYSAISGWAAARKDRGLIEQREQQIAARDLQKAKAEETLNLPANRGTRDRAQFLNDLFLRKAFSWTRVFEDLERVMPARLHVVSIHPAKAPDNQLKIKLVVAGESRDRALELVRKMESSQRFQQTQIEQESTQARTDAGRQCAIRYQRLVRARFPDTNKTDTDSAQGNNGLGQDSQTRQAKARRTETRASRKRQDRQEGAH